MYLNPNSNSHSRKNLVAAAVFAAVVALAWLMAAAQQTPTPQPSVQQQPQDEAPQGQKPPARNPIPDTFTNLQVLPKQISKPELVHIMKSFCVTFEKRCSFCHVATDDLSQADFASDEKETKKKARELLRFILETQKLETQKKPAPTT